MKEQYNTKVVPIIRAATTNGRPVDDIAEMMKFKYMLENMYVCQMTQVKEV